MPNFGSCGYTGIYHNHVHGSDICHFIVTERYGHYTCTMELIVKFLLHAVIFSVTSNLKCHNIIFDDEKKIIILFSIIYL